MASKGSDLVFSPLDPGPANAEVRLAAVVG
jgi:hypothetical protein